MQLIVTVTLPTVIVKSSSLLSYNIGDSYTIVQSNLLSSSFNDDSSSETSWFVIVLYFKTKLRCQLHLVP